MPTAPQTLSKLLRSNPHIHAAWFDTNNNPSALVILRDDAADSVPLQLPDNLRHLRITVHSTQPFKILRLPADQVTLRNQNQGCQNEPIQLGTQIQPQGADWLGTAGAPVSWLDHQNTRHWGILSNWHVMADGDERVGRTQHQPDTNRPAIARLSHWSSVTPHLNHTIDAAIADALLDDFHTITDEIIGIGPIGVQPLDAQVGLNVAKSGRTTGVTNATCTAVGASVRVSYGNFTATLNDQDVYSADNDIFSAPGDSGSLIVGAACRSPTSLLFAGSDTLTIGNPIRHINHAFGLVYPFF